MEEGFETKMELTRIYLNVREVFRFDPYLVFFQGSGYSKIELLATANRSTHLLNIGENCVMFKRIFSRSSSLSGERLKLQPEVLIHHLNQTFRPVFSTLPLVTRQKNSS